MSEFTHEASNLRARCLERLEELVVYHEKINFDPDLGLPQLRITHVGTNTAYLVTALEKDRSSEFKLITKLPGRPDRGPTHRQYLDNADLDELCVIVDRADQVIHDNNEALRAVAEKAVKAMKRVIDVTLWPPHEDDLINAVTRVLRVEIENMKPKEASQ